MLRTQFCVSEWLQLLSAPCYMEGGDAALWALASYWLGPCWFLQGIPVAQCHLWAAGWCEAVQGCWATTALCASKRTYSLSLWAAFGWHSAQEVHPAEGEWLEPALETSALLNFWAVCVETSSPKVCLFQRYIEVQKCLGLPLSCSSTLDHSVCPHKYLIFSNFFSQE